MQTEVLRTWLSFETRSWLYGKALAAMQDAADKNA